MSNESRIYGRRIASWLFLTLLGMHPLVSRPAFAQDAGTSSRLISEASDLVAELESQAASQKEQLLRTEASLRQARALLDSLRAGPVPVNSGGARAGNVPQNTHFSPEEDRQRHALLPAQAVAENTEWSWSDDRANPEYSAEHLGDGYKAEISPTPADPHSVTIRLIHGGAGAYSWKGHGASVFVQRGDVLYYADFSPNSNGCALVAVDLRGGRQLWKTNLWGIGSRSHSQYLNLINMALDGKYVVVYGNEMFGRYIELVDAATGRTAGHRLVAKDEKERGAMQKALQGDAKGRP
jgi:hypothetical protein